MYLVYCRFIGINTLEGKGRKQDFSEGEDELDPVSTEASTAPLGEMSRWVDPSESLSWRETGLSMLTLTWKGGITSGEAAIFSHLMALTCEGYLPEPLLAVHLTR